MVAISQITTMAMLSSQKREQTWKTCTNGTTSASWLMHIYNIYTCIKNTNIKCTDNYSRHFQSLSFFIVPHITPPRFVIFDRITPPTLKDPFPTTNHSSKSYYAPQSISSNQPSYYSQPWHPTVPLPSPSLP